jgi:hypothetical protein
MYVRRTFNERFLTCALTDRYPLLALGKSPESIISGIKLISRFAQWDHTTSIEEIMQSLHLLVQERKVLYLGISDTPAWVVSAANTYAV